MSLEDAQLRNKGTGLRENVNRVVKPHLTSEAFHSICSQVFKTLHMRVPVTNEYFKQKIIKSAF